MKEIEFIEQYIRIITKDGSEQSIKLNNVQKQFIDYIKQLKDVKNLQILRSRRW